jgi:hypothetical protein
MSQPMFAPLQIPPLNFNLSARSGDIRGHTAYGSTPMDGSGWTVNMHTSGNASGATQSRPSIAQALAGNVGGEVGANGIPWMLVIGGLLLWKLAK